MRVILLSGLLVAAALGVATPSADAQTQPPTCFGQPATMVGTDGDDVIDGTEGPDVIVGLGGYDTVDGLGGDDLICGNGEPDGLYGGDGSDQLRGGEAQDGLHGGDGSDELRGGEGADNLFGEGGDDLLVQGGPFVSHPYLANMFGGFGDDRLIGAHANDHLWPGPGRDVVRGHEGNDVVFFGTGPADWSPAPVRGVHVDLAAGEARGQGFDQLYRVEGADGTPFPDVLKGSDGRNVLSSGGGEDVIRGRAGDDFLAGGGGRDTMYGSAGADGLEGNAGRDVSYGGRGADRFYAAEEENSETPRRDALWGGPGSDWARFDYLDRLHSIERRARFE